MPLIVLRCISATSKQVERSYVHANIGWVLSAADTLSEARWCPFKPRKSVSVTVGIKGRALLTLTISSMIQSMSDQYDSKSRHARSDSALSLHVQCDLGREEDTVKVIGFWYIYTRRHATMYRRRSPLESRVDTSLALGKAYLEECMSFLSLSAKQ